MATLPENDRQTGPLPADAGQTVFDADFPLIDAPGDLPGSCVVMQRVRAGVRSELVLGDFAVSGASENGFIATLAAPALEGDVYWILGRQRQARLRAHPQGGAVRTPTLEDDAREAAARNQEAARDLGRALSVPVGETASPLPPVTERAQGAAVFGAAGELTTAPAIPGVQGLLTIAPDGSATVLELNAVLGIGGNDIFDGGMDGVDGSGQNFDGGMDG